VRDIRIELEGMAAAAVPKATEADIQRLQELVALNEQAFKDKDARAARLAVHNDIIGGGRAIFESV
jgi:DNA-binding GntR family transcriptional regulator